MKLALAFAGLFAVTAVQGQARPQLPAEQAAAHTAAAYLGDWRPAPLADLAAAAPDFTVKPGESVQAAIDKVPAEGSKRWVSHIEPGTYRKIEGNTALALGLVAAAKTANKTLVFSGYPITPASSILEQLADMKRWGVKTLQAEDEIAAGGVAIGASFGGAALFRRPAVCPTEWIIRNSCVSKRPHHGLAERLHSTCRRNGRSLHSSPSGRGPERVNRAAPPA